MYTFVYFAASTAELARGEKSCTQSITHSLNHSSLTLMRREQKLSLRNMIHRYSKQNMSSKTVQAYITSPMSWLNASMATDNVLLSTEKPIQTGMCILYSDVFDHPITRLAPQCTI